MSGSNAFLGWNHDWLYFYHLDQVSNLFEQAHNFYLKFLILWKFSFSQTFQTLSFLVTFHLVMPPASLCSLIGNRSSLIPNMPKSLLRFHCHQNQLPT
jgi:hypothetical protein